MLDRFTGDDGIEAIVGEGDILDIINYPGHSRSRKVRAGCLDRGFRKVGCRDKCALTRKPRGEAPTPTTDLEHPFPEEITTRIKQIPGCFMPGRARTLVN